MSDRKYGNGQHMHVMSATKVRTLVFRNQISVSTQSKASTIVYELTPYFDMSNMNRVTRHERY